MGNVQFRQFREAYQYAETIRAADIRNLTTEKGEFKASLLSVDFDKLWMQAGFESLPRSAHVTIGHRPGIVFPAGPADPHFTLGACEVEHGAIGVLNAGSSFFHRTPASSQWASLSLPPDDLMSASVALTGRPIELPENFHVLRPDPVAMVRLTALHAQARQLATDAPDQFLQPTVMCAFEDALTQALIACLNQDPISEQLLRRHHVCVMERFNTFIDSHPGEPLYLAQVCRSIAVSERTLRRCCLEQLGIGPNRYLLLRRLHLARKRLVESQTENTTVTDVATEFGFWALGRFSGMYRTVFGEAPSATLHRASACSLPFRSAEFV